MSKINFDLDGVLYPWHFVIYQELINLNYISPFITYHSFWKNWKSFDFMISQLVKENKYYIISKPVDFAVELLNHFNNQKHEIWYYTQRPDHSYDATKVWLESWHFPQTNNLILSEDKMKLINENYFDYLIDDRIECLDMALNIPNKILVTQPHNEDEKNYRRIFYLWELLDIIK